MTTTPTPTPKGALVKNYLAPGTPLHGSTVVGMTLTAYELANGEFVPFVKVHPLVPATPLVVLV